MIAQVSGLVAEKFNSSLIVDVHGIGYEVQVPFEDFDNASLQESIKLYTYHHIREQSHDLFGFTTLGAKKLFQMLITVQGIGPKAGLAILSVGSAEQVRTAIASGDSVYISKAAGVGKKIAERVVVELSDKVGLPGRTDVNEIGLSRPIDKTDEALEALMALGYSLADASNALEGIPSDISTAERVTQALKG